MKASNHLLRFFVALNCLLIALFTQAEEHWQAADYLQQAFDEVALKNEFEGGTKTVRKWNMPIYVWLEDKTPEADMHRRLTKMHLAHLSSITQHPITLTDSRQQANVTLVFTSEAQWGNEVNQLLGKGALKQLQKAVCMAGFAQDKHGAIIRAGVVIPIDQAQMHRKLAACIVEELTQIMGLPNDSEKVYPSIFNDKTPESLLTGLDALLLKMLYHPDIKVGMTAAQAKPVLTKLITTWQQNGTIANAEKNVRDNELYELMGY